MKLLINNHNFREIPYANPIDIFDCVADEEWSILLDSSNFYKQPSVNNRYSYIGITPFLKITHKNSPTKPFASLKEVLSKYKLIKRNPTLPPFQGGLLGYFGYDLFQYLEKSIPLAGVDDMQFPDMAVGLYDLIISFDHQAKKAWIVCAGFAEADENKRAAYITEELNKLENLITDRKNFKKSDNNKTVVSDIVCNFNKQKYIEVAQKVIDYIYDGDIFETNLSQRFQACMPSELSSYQLYKRLRKINPAPFSAYLNFGDIVIASASPERFLKMSDNHIETRPIKGTRPRGKTLQQDKQFADELIASKKDHAENTMIVDLMRNDLSRVCYDESVRVPQLCGLESFANVHHLVSVVTGQLKNELTPIDLLQATFPGGSITGAPKIRAMQIISELEPTQRGPYCGSIGYIGFDGEMDCSITIRTYAIKNNIVTFQTGGAIIADSNALMEYEETLTKAAPFHRALLNEGF